MEKIIVKTRILGTAIFSSVILLIFISILAIIQIVTKQTVFSYIIISSAIILIVVNLLAIPSYRKYILDSNKGE